MPIECGEGAKSFTFITTDLDKNETHYLIHTDAETVGEALQSFGLIEGDEGPYGLYVKVVCGLRMDYETDGHYWAFYCDGEYAMQGVDATTVEDGGVYAFIAE